MLAQITLIPSESKKLITRAVANLDFFKKAIDYAEQSKGARLPQLRLSNCFNCKPMPCRFPVGDKHWSQV